MYSKNQYLKELRSEYLKTKSKKRKGQLLDEAEKRIGLNRKYLMEKLKPKSNLDKDKFSRKRRKEYYDGYVRSALVQAWRIFDYPCGQRLAPLLKSETDRLRKLGELRCSDKTAAKLKEISFRTIDEKLQHHSDNGTEPHLFRYTQKEGLGFSRSRPSKKNDNCFVEQKNWTHVKKFVGYLRYDTAEEQTVLNNLYRNEVRLYKNFFQPVIKLISKERVGGEIHRKYDRPKTLYQKVMESDKKCSLQKIYLSLNPAELKRSIDKKLDLLYKVYQKKNKSLKVEPLKKLTPISVRKYIAQPEPISVR